MKNIIVGVLAILFTTSALGDATEIPPYLKDATITVKLKNGKEYTFSANTHAVVTRASSNKKKPPIVIEKTLVVEKAVEKIVEKRVEVSNKTSNRVRLLGGVGPTGVEAEKRGQSIVVSPLYGPVGGLGYDRMIKNNVSVGAQIMSNGTGALGLGLDF